MVCRDPILFLHSSIDGHLGCSHRVTLVNNMGIQIPVWVAAFSSFGCRPRSGVAGACGSSMFNLWKKHQTFPQRCTIWRFHQQCTKVPIFPHPCRHFYFPLSKNIMASLACVTISLWFWFAFSWSTALIGHLWVFGICLSVCSSFDFQE